MAEHGARPFSLGSWIHHTMIEQRNRRAPQQGWAPSRQSDESPAESAPSRSAWENSQGAAEGTSTVEPGPSHRGHPIANGRVASRSCLIALLAPLFLARPWGEASDRF